MALIYPATMRRSAYFSVVERSQAGEARRQSVIWAEQAGCSKELQGQLALAITELAGNLVLHTTHGGCLVLRLAEGRGTEAVEVLSLDRGPGNANFNECLRDGYSTAGTAGIGLGVVKRASEFFEVHSQPGVGTALLCIVTCHPVPQRAKHLFGLVNVPVKGEDICGDSAAQVDLGNGRVRVLVADGLGHGPSAAEASQAAVQVFMKEPQEELTMLLEKIHDALKATRGAAVAVADVDAAQGRVRYAGVGNIAGYILPPGRAESTHLVSMNGTLGAVRSRIQEFSYAWEPGALLVMTSDGIKNHWRLDRYAGVSHRHPSLVSGILFRDHARTTDDATVATLGFTTP
ncbi:SpoIIE family protein phosphatase [Prosthecobacter sp.]|uniref:SpoIIE family protein phosphatase n=1 Tax=Prosthecobacter sp. TaxID=1965333 RepID=UPI00378401AF